MVAEKTFMFKRSYGRNALKTWTPQACGAYILEKYERYCRKFDPETFEPELSGLEEVYRATAEHDRKRIKRRAEWDVIKSIWYDD